MTNTKLMPQEPTEEMLKAGCEAGISMEVLQDDTPYATDLAVYKAMFNAAPTIEQEPCAELICDPELLPHRKCPLIKWHVNLMDLNIGTKFYTSSPDQANRIADLETQLREALKRAFSAESELRIYAEDSIKRSEWLYEVKKEAGYDDNVSFDVVWKETLALAQLAKVKTNDRSTN